MADDNLTNSPARSAPSLMIDWNAYLPFFKDQDIPEDQKREMIEALWSVVVAFVDLGFEQRAISCGQDADQTPDQAPDVLALLNEAGLVEMKRGVIEARADQASA